MILRAEHIKRRYGGVVAVDDVSFAVEERSITALIGPNGAGKTTTLNVVSGMTEPSGGRTLLFDKDIAGLRSDQICREGLARTFQTPQMFASMSLRDNVVVGTTPLGTMSLAQVAFGLPRIRNEERDFAEKADHWLDFVGARHLADELAGNLPFGNLRLGELARALASSPKILLMDEPAAGLSRAETQRLRELLFKIRDTGVTILIVEHNMPLIMSTADQVYVLDKGRLLAGGTPAAIQNDASVQKAYLGIAE